MQNNVFGGVKGAGENFIHMGDAWDLCEGRMGSREMLVEEGKGAASKASH